MPKVCRLSCRQAFACRKKVIMTHTDIYSFEFGILKSIRPYNALAIGMTLITELGMIFAAYDLAYLLMTVTVMLSAIYLVLIPVLGKGVEKWTI